MAEEYCGATNWWDSTPSNRSRFDGGGGGGGGSSSTSTTTTLTNSGGGPGFGWLTDGSTPVDTKMDSTSLQLVGLGLSSQAMAEWNQEPTTLLRNPEKADNSFRSMLQEGMGLNTNFQQDATGGGLMFGSNTTTNNSSQISQRREKLFEGNEDLSPEFKQMGRGFSLDSQQPQFSPSGSSIESTITCQGLAPPSGFQHDSSSTSSVFGSPSSILQGLMGGPDQQHQQQINSNFQHNYFGNEQHHHQAQLSSSWAKVPQFLRASSPKQQQEQQQQRQQQEQHHLQFINNATYWSGSASLNEVRPNLFSSLEGAQLPIMPTFEEKPKTTMEVRDSNSTVKKSNLENNTKRTRNDGASSTLPPFKVRKEKMGDRITALQQLVSPFGKTDTASVLSEAIEYIKFLHEQVSVLSNPYLKSGGSYQQHQQSNEKAKMDPDGPKQDLRSRGLCLVPISSTFPVTHETTVDFWTPTFGGTFR